MNKFFYYESIKQHHEELLREAENDRLIREYKKSLKTLNQHKFDHHFLIEIYWEVV